MCILHKWMTARPRSLSTYWELLVRTEHGRKYICFRQEQCAKCGKGRRVKAGFPIWRLGERGPLYIWPEKWDKPYEVNGVSGSGDDVDCDHWPPHKAKELEEYNERANNEEGT